MSETSPTSPVRRVQLAVLLVSMGAMIKFPTLGGLVALGALFYAASKYIADPLDDPPRLPRGLAWLTAVMWAVFIYYTIPLARGFRYFITKDPPVGMGWPREVFGWFVITCVGLLGISVLKFLIKRRERFTPARGILLLVILGLYVWRTLELMKESAEEAIHFLEYGMLCALFFSALSHRHHVTASALIALVLTATCGALDEAVQWATPKRYFDYRDIWLNAYSGGLIALLFAFVIRPPYFTAHFSRASMNTLTRSVCGFLFVMMLLYANTPKAIDAYTTKFPYLQQFKGNWSEMTEYGYEYTDPDIGIFQSRLLPDQLKQQDAERGAEAVKLLKQFMDEHKDYSKAYSGFLREYSAIADPYMHEMRVHLHSRDRNLQKRVPFRAAYEVHILGRDEAEVLARVKGNHEKVTKENALMYRKLTTSAMREHRILYRYFPTVMANYPDNVGEDWLADMEKEEFSPEEYLAEYGTPWTSKVSMNLIKKRTEGQVRGFLIGLALLMIGANVIYGRRSKKFTPADA